jgi:hypothetical protein
MVAHALAHRVAAVLVAMLVATSAGASSAYAAQHDHTGVKRLWSQFPLGPRLRTPAATQAPTTQPPRPSPSAHPQTTPQVSPPGSRHVPSWVWALIAGTAAGLVATIAWLRRSRRSRSAPARPVISSRPLPPPRTRANTVQPDAAVPTEKHPWLSGGPRTLDTLPRAELFAMANALGIENTILMSREELIEALSPRRPVAGAASSAASDRELVRYAAAYAAACREGNPAPILAVTAIVPPTTNEPAAYSKRMVAEARRRGLLTSHGRGKPGGELTAQAKALLGDSAPQSPQSSR